MAVIWADFPSGQRGLYGTNTANMLNGVWGEVSGGTLVADPDSSVTPGGLAFQGGSSDLAPTSRGARFAYPTPAKTQGLGVRLWLNQLPTGNDFTAVIGFRDSTNTARIAMRVLSTGAIEFRSAEGDSGTLYGTTSGPVVTANAFHHLEMKVFSSATVGTVELRVNGFVRLTATGLNTNGADIAQVFIGHNTGFSTNARCTATFKDLVLWDTTGSQCNDFLGAVAVYDIVPDGDEDLQWDLSNGATGYSLVRDDFPSGKLTATGTISDGDVVKVDTTYYRMSTGSLDTGSPAGTSGNPWKVLIGADVATALSNLFKAIGATGVAGTNYSTALTAHTTVDANGYDATHVNVSAKIVTASAISTTETGANLAWEATTLTNGPSDSSYISADNSPPAPTIFTMTDLPEDVISVKAVLPIGRLVKTDGGDCQILMSVSPNGTDYDDGTDRAVTVASTYFWDISHLSPDTGSAWTPDEVNDMRFKVDRTL